MNLTRRDFVKAGMWSTFGAGLSILDIGPFGQTVLAQMAQERDAKLIFIFQRGGNDAVNTVIPYGDSGYSLTNRPTLYIPQANAIDLGNDFAGLHPRMAPIMEIYNHQDLTQFDGPGNLAILHRIGYPDHSRSHFNSQHFWETGKPGNVAFEEGMMYRQVAASMNPLANSLVAAAISSSQMISLKGPLPIPTISDPEKFTFSGNPIEVAKFMGELPTSPQGPDGKGFLGVNGGPHDFPAKSYRDLVYGTGLALADAMSIVQNAVSEGPYQPSGGAIYPQGSFGEKLTNAAMLFKRTPVRLLGINVGGWDTHTQQGQINGKHGDLLAQVAQGFQALYRDLQEQWDKLIIVTVSEFSRTSKENGSQGTDHGEACVMFVAGGSVKGGVYNCDATTWNDGDLFSVKSRYLSRKTDYRAVFGELFSRHFGNYPEQIEQVIPGYTDAASVNPSDFELLNFLPEPAPLPADINGDDTVDIKDLNSMGENWLGNGPEIPADVNKDGKVDLKDFTQMAQDWLSKLPGVPGSP